MTIDHELALEFLRKAEHDLGSARLLLTGENLFGSVCRKPYKAFWFTPKKLDFALLYGLSPFLSACSAVKQDLMFLAGNRRCTQLDISVVGLNRPVVGGSVR